MRIKKELREYIKSHTDALKASNMDLKSVYEIMFMENGLIMCESQVGYRIRRWSYAEMKTYCDRCAALLYSKIGATHSYVALEMENCVEWIMAYWAILKSGNKPYLVNCRHPHELSEGILKTLDIDIIIGMNKTGLTGTFVDFRAVADEAMAGEVSCSCPDDVFENEFCLSTSATSLHQSICFYTGKEISKQILDAEAIVEESPRMASMYHGSIKQLAFLPFYHIFGLFAVYFWFAFFGRTFVFLKNYAPDTITRTIRRHEVTHIFAVPLLWHTVEDKIMKEIRRQPPKKQKAFYTGLKLCTALQNISPYIACDLSKKIMGEVTDQVFGPSVRFLISGGSYIRQSTLDLFNGIGYPLHNGYGMSEVGITSVELRKRPKDRNQNSVGHPLESIEYSISPSGTLLIKGTSISSKIMIDGVVQERGEWFDTMDMAELKDGYCFIKGRAKDTIIGADGENINPDLVEQMIKIDGVNEFSCFGEKDDRGNESLALVIRVGNDMKMSETDAIYREVMKINESIQGSFKIKKFYFTLDPLMASTAIKVSRQYLLRGIENGDIKLIPMKDFVPRDKETVSVCNEQILKAVIKIVADVLDIEESKIKQESNIVTDLGATSLQFFAIMAKISEEFAVETYSCNTIGELGKYIEEQTN